MVAGIELARTADPCETRQRKEAPESTQLLTSKATVQDEVTNEISCS